ncbi:MAG: monomethylamine:corrinoid methyltransferase [Bilophila wadsworthia]
MPTIWSSASWPSTSPPLTPYRAQDGRRLRECYNLVTVQPQKWYMDMYDKVKKELTQMGLPMEY